MYRYWNFRATLENKIPLASSYTKPNSFHKTPCFGLIPTEEVFLVNWNKINFRCTALKKPKCSSRVKKGYSWKTGIASLSGKFFFANIHQNIALESWHYKNDWSTSPNKPTNHLGKWVSTIPTTRNTKFLKMVHFWKSNQKIKVKAIILVKVEVKLKLNNCLGRYLS